MAFPPFQNISNWPHPCDIFLTMGKHRHVSVEIRYAAILFLKRQFAGDVGHAGRKHRQMKLGHGTVSPDEGKKTTELPPPSHHPRILSIRPRSARCHPAFLVGRIDLANNFAITPLHSHPSEIRSSEIAMAPVASITTKAAPNWRVATIFRPPDLRRCESSGVIAKLFAKSMQPTRKAG